MSQTLKTSIAVVGIDIGKNSFHLVGHDQLGAIVLRQKWSRGQVEARLANLPPCLVGMEACVGAHHLSRKLQVLGHNARLMPAKYVRPYSRGPVSYTHLRAHETGRNLVCRLLLEKKNKMEDSNPQATAGRNTLKRLEEREIPETED